MKKTFLSIVALAAMSLNALAYDVNPIITAMPALTIAPDAHAAGMGDIGAATTPDMNSQFWNAAKYAFIEDKGGISASYTPWLRKLVNDIDLAYLTGFYRFDDKQAISASFTYFSMGEVALIGLNSNYESGLGSQEDIYATAKPNEWSLDVAYSRKLHEYVSMAATLRFMYSDLNNGINYSGTGVSTEMYPAFTFAADVSLYYRQPIELPMGTSHFALGFTISNLGGKMSYDKNVTSNFIPARMRLGVSYEIPFDNYNRLMASVECDRLLVPSTYSVYTEDPVNYKWNTKDQQEYSKVSSPKGWWQSFNDAPGGAKEEFNEMRWGVGLEYSYNRQFFGRVGYSHEDRMKGNRRYVTLGAGFKLSIVRFDVAYCIATAASNPLDQTMRFTLGFDLAGIKDLVNNKR